MVAVVMSRSTMVASHASGLVAYVSKLTKSCASGLLIIGVMLSLANVSYAAIGSGVAPWSQHGGDPQHTGYSYRHGPGPDISDVVSEWTKNENDPFLFDAAVGLDAQGLDVVFVGGIANFYAYDRSSTKIWTTQLDSNVSSTPAVDDLTSHVMVATTGESVSAYDMQTGSHKWSVNIATLPDTQLTTFFGSLYVGSSNGVVYSVDCSTGSIRWKTQTNGTCGTPAVDEFGHAIYVHTSSGWLVSLDTADGGINWRTKVTGPGQPPVGITTHNEHDSMYLNIRNEGVVAIQAETGAIEWSAKTDISGGPTPAIGPNERLYVAFEDDKLMCFNMADGSMEWEADIGASVAASPTIGADEMVYVGCSDSTVKAFAFDTATNGKLLWSYKVDSPVVSSMSMGLNSRMYVTTSKGSLYALEGARQIQPSPAPHLIPTAQWPQRGFSPQRTGQSNVPGPADDAKVNVTWLYTTGGAVATGAAIDAAGTIYIGSEDNNMYALHSSTGKLKWQYKTGGKILSYPALSNDGKQVIFGSDDDNVYSVSAATGKMLWSLPVDGAAEASPCIDDYDVIYVTTAFGMAYALDNHAGEPNWQFSIGAPLALTSPTLSQRGHLIYFGSANAEAYALHTKTGKVAWKFVTGAPFTDTPCVGTEGRVYLISRGALLALDGEYGDLLWESSTVDFTGSSPSVGVDGTVYCGSFDGHLYAVDGGSGKIRWSYDTYNEIHAYPVMSSSGVLYFGSKDNSVHVVESVTGRQIRQVPVGGDVLAGVALTRDGGIVVGAGNSIAFLGSAAPAPARHSGGSSGSAGGWIFVGLFFGFIVIYLVAAVAFNHHKTGQFALPTSHKLLWGRFFGLVVDGSRFLVSGCKSGSGSTYREWSEPVPASTQPDYQTSSATGGSYGTV